MTVQQIINLFDEIGCMRQVERNTVLMNNSLTFVSMAKRHKRASSLLMSAFAHNEAPEGYEYWDQVIKLCMRREQELGY